MRVGDSAARPECVSPVPAAVRSMNATDRSCRNARPGLDVIGIDEDLLLATLEEIGLPARAVTVLDEHGCAMVGQLIRYDETDLLRMDNLGPRSVRSIKASLATWSLEFGIAIPNWDEETARRQRIARDPCIKLKLAALRGDAAPRFKTVAEEAEALFGSLTSGRDLDILRVLHGLDGEPLVSRAGVGRRFGLSIERVRMIGLTAQAAFAAKWRPLPRLDEAISRLARAAPGTARRLATALAEPARNGKWLLPDAVLAVAAFAGRSLPISRYQVGGAEFYGSTGDQGFMRHCLLALREKTRSKGYADPRDIASDLGLHAGDVARIVRLLDDFPETTWLGGARGLAVSRRIQATPLTRQVEKIFYVTERIGVDALHHALGRWWRRDRSGRTGRLPSSGELAVLVQALGLARREGESLVRSRAVPITRLAAAERAFCDAFSRLGVPLTRQALARHCETTHGIRKDNFSRYLTYSPIVRRVATACYCLVSSKG